MIERYLQLLFAQASRSLRRANDDSALDSLFIELDQLRRTVTPQTWTDTITDFAHKHPITDIFLEDPYTRLAAQQSDWSLADSRLEALVYSHRCPPGTSELGERVFRCTTRRIGVPLFHQRCQQVTHLIQRIARDRSAAEITVLGCGQLRAAHEIDSPAWGRLNQLLAVDAQSDNLMEIEQNYANRGVRPLQGSAAQLLAGDLQLPPQDLICVSGWLDYLDPATARQLVQRLVALLKSGGYLSLSNLSTDSPGQGYMELFMNWHPHVRDEERLLDEVIQPIAHRLREIELTRNPQRSMVQFLARAA